MTDEFQAMRQRFEERLAAARVSQPAPLHGWDASCPDPLLATLATVAQSLGASIASACKAGVWQSDLVPMMAAELVAASALLRETVRKSREAAPANGEGKP